MKEMDAGLDRRAQRAALIVATTSSCPLAGSALGGETPWGGYGLIGKCRPEMNCTRPAVASAPSPSQIPRA